MIRRDAPSLYHPFWGYKFKEMKPIWRVLWVLFCIFVVTPLYVVSFIAIIVGGVAFLLLMLAFICMGMGAVFNTESAIKNWVKEQNNKKF
jgi:hypothetical protein